MEELEIEGMIILEAGVEAPEGYTLVYSDGYIAYFEKKEK